MFATTTTHPPGLGVATWGLILIGDNAPDKVGLCGPQVGHQLVEVLLERRDGTRGREAELETAVDQPAEDWGQAPKRASTRLSFHSVPVPSALFCLAGPCPQGLHFPT